MSANKYGVLCSTRSAEGRTSMTLRIHLDRYSDRMLCIRPHFNWRDIWVGVYVSDHRNTWYVCILPMIVLGIWYRRELVFGSRG